MEDFRSISEKIIQEEEARGHQFARHLNETQPSPSTAKGYVRLFEKATQNFDKGRTDSSPAPVLLKYWQIFDE